MSEAEQIVTEAINAIRNNTSLSTFEKALACDRIASIADKAYQELLDLDALEEARKELA